jgi:hypothetical protein
LSTQIFRYFYLPARGEHRGVGGLFFDDMTKSEEGATSSSSSSTPSTSNPGSSSSSMSSGGSMRSGQLQLFDAEAFTRDVGKGIFASWAPIAGGLSVFVNEIYGSSAAGIAHGLRVHFIRQRLGAGRGTCSPSRVAEYSFRSRYSPETLKKGGSGKWKGAKLNPKLCTEMYQYDTHK